MQTAKALTVSIFAAAISVTLPSLRDREVRALDYLGASVPAPEPRDLVLLVMSLAAIALTGRRSK